MSIINKMLQDLDKRQATQDADAHLLKPATPTNLGSPGSGNLAQQARPVMTAAFGSNLFWRVMAAVMVVVVAWVLWVAWQLMPRSALTDRAIQLLVRNRPASPQQPQVQPLAAEVASGVIVAAQTPVPPPTAPQPVTAVAPPSPALPAAAPAPVAAPGPNAASTAPPSKTASIAAQDSARIDMLRLATSIATPIKSRPAIPAPPARSARRETIAAIKPEARVATMTDRRAEPARVPGRGPADPAPEIRGAGAASDVGRIDKRVDVTARERAESEFRRAMVLVNQGRMAEGMEGLKAALAADSSYDLVRQTLVALLLEAKRNDEAASLLQDGLALNPSNVGYGMLLARIHVDQGDPGGALALLRKFEAKARTNAEYQGFVAALYQRLGRHVEAVEQYQGALRLTGGVGTWWVGLGISQEALSRQQEATESFHRAKRTGSLSPELLAYVERRLKQLQ